MIEKSAAYTRHNTVVNITTFGSKRPCKQYFVTATFTCKPVSVYEPKLAVAIFSYFTYYFHVRRTNGSIGIPSKIRS